jgi:purine-binding chemotaxis protein CheW
MSGAADPGGDLRHRGRNLAVPVARCARSWIIRNRSTCPARRNISSGLIDVRGVGVPTIDLRLRLGLPPGADAPDPHPDPEVPREGRKRCCWAGHRPRAGGQCLCPQRSETAPDIGVRWRSDYITGVIRQDGGFVVLIDIAAF